MKIEISPKLIAQWEAEIADRDETIKLLRELSASVEQNAVRKEREAVVAHLREKAAKPMSSPQESGLLLGAARFFERGLHIKLTVVPK